jgi:hypothetical protein
MTTSIQSTTSTQGVPVQGNSSTTDTTETPEVSSSPNHVYGAVTQMVGSGEDVIEGLSKYASSQTEVQMIASNAAAIAEINNTNTLNTELSKESSHQFMANIFGDVAEICGIAVTACLSLIDPFLGASSTILQGLNITGLTQDLVGWISDGLQDVDPNLTDAEAKAISDVILVTAAVIAAVIVGVLTAGTGDAVIAEGAAEIGGEAIAEDAATKVVSDIGADVGSEIATDAETAIEDVGNTVTDGEKKAQPKTGQRIKRGAKFAAVVGSQMTMQTNMDVNVVQALASMTSNPDSAAWKAIELLTFVAEVISCFCIAIGGGRMGSSDIITDSLKGNPTYLKMRKLAQRGALISAAGETLSDSVSGFFSLLAAQSYSQMKDVVFNMILLNSLKAMSSATEQTTQKATTALERSILEGQDLPHVLVGYEMPA